MHRLDFKRILDKIKIKGDMRTMHERCFESGYDSGYLDALYKAREMMQNCDIGWDSLYDEIIKEYEDRNVK